MSAFEACYAAMMKWERGYADHPRDPGGKTMDGVTERVFHAWQRRNGEALRPVKTITTAEKHEIYREQYWNAVKGELLPPGIDLAVFDFAVNSGPSRAIRHLQAALGVKQDGVIGNVTLQAALEAYKADKDADVIRRIMAYRLAFVKALGTWKVFGKGWGARISDISAVALRMEAIEDGAKLLSVVSKKSLPASRVDRGADVAYAPTKATAPHEPIVETVTKIRTAGWLTGILSTAAAALTAAQTAITGVKEALDGVLPSGSAVMTLAIVAVAVGAAVYGWMQAKTADVELVQ